MAENKLSAREAALIAQARAQLAKTAAPPQEVQPAQPAAIRPVAKDEHERSVPAPAVPAPDAAERIAALMQAARAESERQRQRRRKLYVWTPLAFITVLGLWTLLWLWHRL